MESLIKADIFFFIASVATVVLAILLSVLVVYLIKAGKNLYMLSETLKECFTDSQEFVEELRERLEDNLVFRMFFPPARRKKKATKKDT
ncbi:MAG: hypothetical protein ACD_81C00038G0004 [uncultured bacterium]|uniref:Uncharacterized protein n=1 Tax=Candidatus Wolfebacteria bacterium GW2011_GWE2_44_13 TaxID=1619017 RepID=A0A0G1HAW5_9BACT|nr:MAG: hypothetical protein ACD_81C00038G0004 [uncultured bacterium]KKT43930.1 MAG: hypothetical protein UW32_C0001G0522 [Candidatus Wolfebacteria bacterium GW2011_GWE2_44_13]